jgi:tripartite-type tricarboxylate transporter receptor subunit TctC
MRRRSLLAGAAGAAIVTTARAQNFPAKPLRLIVPFTPGGTTDILAREIAAKLQVGFGQSCVVENRPGGGGTIGCELVARSEPDGLTMLMGHIGTLAINPLVYPKHSYDPVKGWTPLAYVANVPNVLTVNPSVPASSVPELVAMAKAKPGALTFGSMGNGSGAHLAAELFKTKAGIDMLHVPYKGLAPMTTELLAGRVDLSIAPLPGLIAQQIASGNIRALGIASARRTPQLDTIPTFAEAGVSGVEADAWSALFAPAKTPSAVIDQLYKAVAAALANESVRASLARQGLPVALKTPAEMSAMLPGEVAKWAAVIKLANVTVE